MVYMVSSGEAAAIYSLPTFFGLVNNYPVAGHLQIRLAAVIFFGGGDHLAEFSFQLRFGESQFFGGGGIIRRLTGLTTKYKYSL